MKEMERTTRMHMLKTKFKHHFEEGKWNKSKHLAFLVKEKYIFHLFIFQKIFSLGKDLVNAREVVATVIDGRPQAMNL